MTEQATPLVTETPQTPPEPLRREVITFWAFGAFLLAGVVALAIDAFIRYT